MESEILVVTSTWENSPVDLKLPFFPSQCYYQISGCDHVYLKKYFIKYFDDI